MAKYYYKKYTKSFSPWSQLRLVKTETYGRSNSYYDLYQTINSTSIGGNAYSYIFRDLTLANKGYEQWNGPFSDTLEYGYIYSYYKGYFNNWNMWDFQYYCHTRTYIPGTFQAEILAEDGTYPIDGAHTDGFYYVRDRQAFPEMWVNINGTQRKCEEGWVNINGVWKAIEEIYVNINGVWRKSE